MWIPVGAAVIAAAVAVWSAFLQRKTGKESTTAASESAAAARTSAEASGRSAKAAEDAVELNRSTATAAGDRADAAALAQRYQEAASQLGHDKAAVRLAGVYAMSRLADDWPAERQTCIDVLCAYLRLPWRNAIDSDAFREEAQVRRTIVSGINRHVAEDAKNSWSANDFDFTKAELRDFVVNGCTFAGRTTFSGAEFVGDCVLNDILFEEGAFFEACVISGRVRLADMRAPGTHQLACKAMRVASDAELEITTNTKDPKGANSWTDFGSMVVQGKLTVQITRSPYRQSLLNLDDMTLDRGCVVISKIIRLRDLSSPSYLQKIRAWNWKISAGSQIRIDQDLIDNGTVTWIRSGNQPAIPDDVEMTFILPVTNP
jgi:hypothetical protein